jgi:diacylglycerol kinase (ATP)
MKPCRVILNPTAGHGNGLKAIPTIEHFLAMSRLTYDLVRTEFRGHGIELARQAAVDGIGLVVAAGGDGTVNEAINGLMQAKQAGLPLPLLGVLPVGRGNDFVNGVGIPENLEQACQALIDGQRRWIDIGRVVGGICPEGRYFGNFVGVGFDAIVTIQVSKLPRWGGFFSFLLAVLNTVFLYNHAPLATIEFDDQTLTQRSLLISIMNGRRLGGGFIMAPDSSPADGKLDLCIAEQMNSIQVLQHIPYFFRGTQATRPKIKMARASRIKITAHDGAIPAQVDGEILSTEATQLEIELLPHQIEIIFQQA